MKYILTFVVTLFTLTLSAQDLPERGLVRRGNRDFNKNEYKGAIESYDKAHQAAPDSFEALYNYANALHKDEQYAKAEELYNGINAEELPSDGDRADLFYNLGNSQFMQQKYKEALESYKSSLRANPDDQDTKYNYAYTKKLLEDQQQQQDQQDQNKDQDKDKNQDQNQDQNKDQNQDQDKQDQDQNGDDKQDQNKDQDQNGDDQKDQGDQGDDKQDKQDDQQGGEQPAEGKISPQEQAQMLDAIQAQEDKTQEKLEEKGKGVIVRGRKNW